MDRKSTNKTQTNSSSISTTLTPSAAVDCLDAAISQEETMQLVILGEDHGGKDGEQIGFKVSLDMDSARMSAPTWNRFAMGFPRINGLVTGGSNGSRIVLHFKPPVQTFVPLTIAGFAALGFVLAALGFAGPQENAIPALGISIVAMAGSFITRQKMINDSRERGSEIVETVCTAVSGKLEE